MRLINIQTLRLEQFQSAETAPPYAILSHRWGSDEVNLGDFEDQLHAEEISELQSQIEDLHYQLRKLQSVVRGDGALTPTQPATDLPLDRHISALSLERERPSIPAYRLRARRKSGWWKVIACCREAQKFGLDYLWVDTCCIDQNSSAELSESINSMFAWYRDAKICIAYLFDVECPFGLDISALPLTFKDSEWFRRGWTLQELLAPREVWFFDRNWKLLGLRSSLAYQISSITGIDEFALGSQALSAIPRFSVAERFSWAATRVTTRTEDRAYSLLGLFGVNMPTLYGEGGAAAFFRLQVQIFQVSPDHSILAWESEAYPLDRSFYFNSQTDSSRSYLDLFATSLDSFEYTRSIDSKANTFKKLNLGPRSALYDGSPAVPEATSSEFSHGLRIPLLMRTRTGTDVSGRPLFQACLPCKSRLDDRLCTINLTLMADGRFKRQASAVEWLDRRAVEQMSWYWKDVTIFSPQGRLESRQHSHLFRSAFNPVKLRLNDLDEHGVEFGGSGLMAGDTVTQLSSFSIELDHRSRIVHPSLLPDQPRGDEECTALVFRVSKTGDVFAVVLTIIGCRLKAVIVQDLDSAAFRQGYEIGDLKAYAWQDLSLCLVNEVLSSGKLVFVSSTIEKGEEGNVDSIVLAIGIHSVCIADDNVV